MTLVRFRPETELPSIPRRFSEMLDEFFNESMTGPDRNRSFMPGIDITEDERQFHINVMLPGMKREDINIDLEDRQLTISGERTQEREDKNVKYHLVESRYGSFERTFTLPDNVNLESINARYEDGVLRVTIDKNEKQVSKQIKVK